MTEIKLKLPWPPSVNNYKNVGALSKTKSGKLYQTRYNSKETTAYYYEVYMIAKQSLPAEWAKFACSDTILYQVEVDAYPPDYRRRDLDNLLKVLLDSLMHAHVIKDDSQICRLIVQKMDNIPQGQLKVRVKVFVRN